MTDCIITFRGERYIESKLDELLRSMEKSALEAYLGGTPLDQIFSKTTAQDESNARVQAAFKAYTDKAKTKDFTKEELEFEIASLEEAEDGDTTPKKTYIPGTIGVTKLFQYVGNPKDWDSPLCTPYNEKVYRRELISKLKDETKHPEYKGLNDQQIEEIADNMLALNDVTRQLGTDIHKIISCIITGDKLPAKFHYLPNDLIAQVKAIAENIVKQIKDKHGKDAIIYSERSVVSEKVDPTLLEKVKIATKKACDGINGTIDILVIDENGIAHVYDIKTSGKKVGVWNQFENDLIKSDEWSSAKKLSCTAQTATYASILRQYGIKVGSCNIIPIRTSLNTDSNSKFTNVSDVVLDEIQYNLPQSLIGRQASNIRRILPSTSETKLGEIQKVNELIGKLYPSVSKFKQIKRTERQVDFYLKNRRDFVKAFVPRKNNFDDERREKMGVKYFFIEEGLPGEPKVYCTSEEDVIAKLTDYVEKQNKLIEEELEQLGVQLNVAIADGSDEALEKLATSFGEKFKEDFKIQFQKYIKQRWEFIENKDYNSNGIFIFKKGNRVELVLIDSRLLSGVEELDKGQTILGNTRPDGEVDSTLILNSQYGNLLLMKAAACIALNRNDILEGDEKISRVRVVNPYHGTEFNVLNDTLIQNWDMLASDSRHLRKDPLEIPLLNKSDFMDDLEASYYLADDIVASNSMKLNGLTSWTTPSSETEFNERLIDNAIRKLKIKYPDLYKKGNFDFKRPEWRVYTHLLRAKMYSRGLHAVIETDIGNYFDAYSPTGLMITAPDNSKSANVRMLGRTMALYRRVVTDEFNSISFEWQKLLNAFYKEEGHSKLLGNERPLFMEWLRTDDSGEIDKRFLFKHESDQYWTEHPAAWKAAKYFMDKMFNFKYGHLSEREQEKHRSGDEWYEVPIVEQASLARIREAGVKETLKTAKDKVDAFMNLVGDTFAGKTEYRRSWEDNESNEGVLYNKYLDLTTQQRENILNEKGLAFCEKDLDLVFNAAAVAGCQSKASRSCHMLFTGMHVLLMAENAGMKTKNADKDPMQNILSFFENYIKRRVYHKSIIEEQMQPIAGLISGMKGIVSTMTLGFNTRALFREGLQSGYTMTSRALLHQLGNVKVDDIMKQYVFMTEEMPKNFDNLSFCEQLSHRYSMANYSMPEMGDANRVSYWGLFNMNSNVAFQTTSAFDFFYRNALLLAKLTVDGCRDAYYLDDEGKLIYDMSKDSRFTTLRINNGKVSWDTSNPDYLKEQQEYNKFMKLFLQEGRTVNTNGVSRPLQMGDLLPDAYPALIANGIRADADTLLGHFDDETKALMMNTFLGSLFMQFKTFFSAKFEQALSSPRATNVLQFEQQYDNEGRRIFEVFCTPEEIEQNGGQVRKFLVEGKPEDQEELDRAISENRAQPYAPLWGKTLEGTLVQTIEFAKALLNANQEDLNKMWEDPVARGRLTLFMMDNFGMMLLALLIKMLYGEDVVDDMKNMDWFTRWSYGILMGATQDGPILQVLDGLVGDITPPMVSSLQKAITDWGSVLAGNKNAFYAILNSFGATRELTALTQRMF